MNSGIYGSGFGVEVPYEFGGMEYIIDYLSLENHPLSLESGEKLDVEFFYYDLTNLLEGDTDITVDFDYSVHRSASEYHTNEDIQFTVVPPVYESAVCFRYV
ncbi:MAG: hypothetical protein N2317_02180 [Syntrophales bacterium]|nr:hypothetical protein [Syntrophales bacterium]